MVGRGPAHPRPCEGATHVPRRGPWPGAEIERDWRGFLALGLKARAKVRTESRAFREPETHTLHDFERVSMVKPWRGFSNRSHQLANQSATTSRFRDSIYVIRDVLRPGSEAQARAPGRRSAIASTLTPRWPMPNLKGEQWADRRASSWRARLTARFAFRSPSARTSPATECGTASVFRTVHPNVQPRTPLKVAEPPRSAGYVAGT